ncbi:WXG100 family type VII secretion target [Brachybacterium sp. AOP42-B2-9]|uniref:WXG100 family type VII secretion target n=1 Tax=Brachybacterium sp. AOP42-B2-9 TaxID=3457672 RepID=UPI0040344CBD
MSTFLGSDTDALRELAQRYDAQASALENSAGATVQSAPAVSWVGPDAEEFRSSCHQVRAQLTDVLERIRRWADDFDAEADEQDAASTADSAGSGPRGGGTGSDRSPLDILKDFPFGTGDGDSWSLPDIFPRISPHEWVPPLLKEGADVVADRVEKGLPVAERVLKKGTPLIPDLYDASRHYLNGETAEGNFAVMRAGVSAVPYLGAAVDLADLATSGDPDGSILDQAENWYVEKMNDPNSAMSRGEQIGLQEADERGIENKYARNIFKVVMGNGTVWEETNLHRDENGDINPWMT